MRIVIWYNTKNVQGEVNFMLAILFFDKFFLCYTLHYLQSCGDIAVLPFIAVKRDVYYHSIMKWAK
jgi:hypothetical protein